MPAASGHFRAGKSSRVQCNAQNMTANQWSATYNGVDLDVTNFESNGYSEGIIGILSLTWSLSAKWNAAQNPNASPPGLFPTDSGTNLNLYVNVSDNTAYAMSSFRCFNGTASTTTEGNVEFVADGKSQGAFSVPTSQA